MVGIDDVVADLVLDLRDLDLEVRDLLLRNRFADDFLLAVGDAGLRGIHVMSVGNDPRG
jgi:hypothetical protein